MKKTTNIEQSQFIDVLASKEKREVLSFQVLVPGFNNYVPVYNETIEWRKITTFKSYKESKYDIREKEHKEAIDRIIKLYQAQQTFSQFFIQNQELIGLLKKSKELIKKYSHERFPKAVAAQYLFSMVPELRQQLNDKQVLSKLQQVNKRTDYPLSSLILALHLIRFVGNQKKIEEYFKKAIEYGQLSAFCHYGYFCFLNSNAKKAYQMYKNAEAKGYIPLSYYRLAQLFVSNFQHPYHKNIVAANKYLEKAKDHQIKLSEDIKNKMKMLFEQIKAGEKISSVVKTTPQTQAKVVAGFINLKYLEAKIDMKEFKFRLNRINNITIGGEAVCFVPKIFYVVFSALLNLPSRQFLAFGQDKNIEQISIYNWQQIEPRKLALLHKLGTKVVIRQYMRKYGTGDHLPMFRVENPEAIQIYPGTEKHCISDEKYREMGKVLFSSGLFDMAEHIYNHLINKNAQNLEVIYCNLGLVQEKKLNLKAAKNYYSKSLKVKKNDKSLYRLARIYLNEQNFSQATKLCQQIQGAKEKNQIQALLSQLQRKRKFKNKQMTTEQFLSLNLNDAKYFAKPRDIQIQRYIVENDYLKGISNSKTFGSCIVAGTAADYLLYFRQQLSNLLGISLSISDEKFIQQMQQICNSDQAAFNKNSLFVMARLFTFCYDLFERNSNNLLFDQAFGYLTIYVKYGLSLNLMQIPMNIQYCANLVNKMHAFQNRIQIHCIQLEKEGRYAQALQIYRCGDNYCIPFAAKICQILYKMGKHEENIKYCEILLTKLKKFKDFRTVFMYFLVIGNQHLKSLQMLKQFEKASKVGQLLIDYVKKANPQFLFMYYSFQTPQQYFCWLMSQQNLVYKKKCELQKVCKLTNNVANCHFVLRQFELADKYLIDIGTMNKLKNINKELYFSTLLLKIKVYTSLKKSKQQLKVMLAEAVQIAQNFQTKRVKNIYCAVIYKQLLQFSITEVNIQEILKYSIQIYKLGDRFIEYIIINLISLSVKNQKACTHIINGLRKADIQQIKQELIERLTKIYLKKGADGINIDKQLIQCLNLHIQQGKYEQFHKRGTEQEENQENAFEEQQIFQENVFQAFQQLTNSNFNIQFQRQFDDKFEDFDYITNFIEGNNHYAVYFANEINFDKREKQKFIISANKICKKQVGSNGIKIHSNELRLKIKGSSRLTGFKEVINGISYLFFIKKESHDDYKRKK